MEFTPTQIVDMVGILPIEIVVTFALAKMLKMRNVVAFWVTRMGIILVLCLLRSVMDPGLRVAIGQFANILLPLLFSQGKLSRRVFVIVLVSVILAVTEIAGIGLWLALTGLPLVEGTAWAEYSVEFTTVRVVHLLLAITLMSGLYALLGHFSPDGDETGLEVFGILPLTQMLLLSISIIIMQFLPHETDFFNYGNLVAAILCVIVDVILFISLGKYRKKRQVDQHVELLQLELDTYLREYRLVADDLESVALLRHDLRNQLQVVEDLSAQGKAEEARDMLRTMILRCGEGSSAVGLAEGAPK